MFFCVQKQKKRRNKFTCVYFDKRVSKYLATFTYAAKNYFCGYFLTELEAAQAVNIKCVELDIPLKNPEIALPEYEPQVKFI